MNYPKRCSHNAGIPKIIDSNQSKKGSLIIAFVLMPFLAVLSRILESVQL
jgi:hypothetical protein